MKMAGTGVAGSALGAFGFTDAEAMIAAHVRPFKLAKATETRNTCPYCAVACGIVMYSRGDVKKGEKAEIIPHRRRRRTIQPIAERYARKARRLLDFVNAETRTKYPQVREPGSKEWKRISWDEALDRIARLMKDDRDKNFIATNKDGVTVNRWTTTGFLAASATTNETALLTYKVVRSTGMVVFDNQARVCHGSTVASLAPTFGRGAMTNSWIDIKNTDLAIIMGGNAAEAHPCGFKWVTEAKAHRGAKLIVVDPRFTRSAAVADLYAPIRQGTDIAFLLGVINYCIQNNKIQWEYVKAFTNAPYIVKESFGFHEGLFTGYDEAKRDYDRSSWNYEMGDDGFVKADDTLQHPRCVWNLLKEHVKIYTPELVSRICGTPQDKYLKVCEMIAETSAPNKAMTSMYALGWTQHSKGAQNIRGMAMLQLLLGNIGIRGGGMNALRGHSNIQGLTDMGLMSNLHPWLFDACHRQGARFRHLHGQARLQAGTSEPDELLAELQKVLCQFPEIDVRRRREGGERLGLSLSAQARCALLRPHARLRVDEPGQDERLLLPGLQPAAFGAEPRQSASRLSKLKFLVVMDPLQTETAQFWEDHGEYNDATPENIGTAVFELPTTCFAEDEGSLTNSGRWLQWHWAGGTPPGEAKHDSWIMAQLHKRLKALYQKEGGAFPDAILNLTWNYADPGQPAAGGTREGDQRFCSGRRAGPR